jgi:hypothetical protein
MLDSLCEPTAVDQARDGELGRANVFGKDACALFAHRNCEHLPPDDAEALVERLHRAAHVASGFSGHLPRHRDTVLVDYLVRDVAKFNVCAVTVKGGPDYPRAENESKGASDNYRNGATRAA